MFERSERINSFMWIGFTLQLLFIVLFFSSFLSFFPHSVAAIICLLIGFISLFCGIRLIKTSKPAYLYAAGLGIIIVSSLIIIFTIFTYFLVEPGQTVYWNWS